MKNIVIIQGTMSAEQIKRSLFLQQQGQVLTPICSDKTKTNERTEKGIGECRMIVVSNDKLVFFGRPEKIKNQVCEIKYFEERTAGWPESMEDIIQFAVDTNGDIANDEKVIYWDERRIWHGVDVKNNQFKGFYFLSANELRELKIDQAKNAEAMINYSQDDISR